MIIFLVVVFFSFILECFLSNFFNGTLFSPLFVLSLIILISPYFKKNKCRYYIICGVLGFLYDLVYTGNYFLNMSLFLIVGLFSCLIDSNMSDNILVLFLKVILLITLYRLLMFLYFVIFNMVIFSFNILFKSIYNSFILNIIYSTILYFFFVCLFKRHRFM